MKLDRRDEKARSFLLKNIPPYLWQTAKHRVIDEKITLRELLIKALLTYMDGKKDER